MNINCESCAARIEIHADGSAACACEHIDFVDARKEWPMGWSGNEEEIETAQARELLQQALEDESDELKDYVFDHVDELDVMRRANGDAAQAVEICRAARADSRAQV